MERKEFQTGQDEIGLLRFPMIPLGLPGVPPLLSLYVGVLLCTGASLACTHPPCRETLVAAPIQPISGAGTGAKARERQTGATSSGMGVALLAVSNAPRRVEHRHSLAQVQPKVGLRPQLPAMSSHFLSFSKIIT